MRTFLDESFYLTSQLTASDNEFLSSLILRNWFSKVQILLDNSAGKVIVMGIAPLSEPQ